MSSDTDDRDSNGPIAFALVCGAGLSTALGASMVYFPKLVQMTSKYTLASSLGMSAGVMLYVSFAEISMKSLDSFVEAGDDDDTAFMKSTGCFFAGALFMILLDFVVHALVNTKRTELDAVFQQGQSITRDPLKISVVSSDAGEGDEVAGILPSVLDDDANPNLIEHAPSLDSKRDNEVEGKTVPHCVGCSTDPSNELEHWKNLAAEEDKINAADDNVNVGEAVAVNSTSTKGTMDTCEETEDKELMKMGLNTAVAIALHNFPEGLATFVAAMDDPSVGAVLAIAIGIHNIPEGICVALPIYYSGSSRRKAFAWALLSGISEPIAGLFGWFILSNSLSPTTYAILFGLVSGMMVTISTKELLPTAHRYDKDDKVVTYSFIGGMAIMALSLALFRI